LNIEPVASSQLEKAQRRGKMISVAVRNCILAALGASLGTAVPIFAETYVIPPPKEERIPPKAAERISPPTSVTIEPMQQMQGESQFWLHAGVESWSGDNTYQIGFPVTDSFGNLYEGYFPFSELKFPLDVVFGVVKVKAVIRNRFVFDALVKKNITEPDDNMEDRDWLTDANPSQLDVYSDSEVVGFDGFVFDVDLAYKVLCRDKGWLAAGAGYMYQNFEYDTAVIHQWSPSGIPGFEYVGDGTKSIYYEVNYKIPYFLLSGQLTLNPQFTLNGRFAYAPWVSADNRDQHLLRYKENRAGDLDGDAYMLSVDAQYDFWQHWFLTGGLSYTSIDVDGDMDATFFGIYDHTVREELESEQTSLYLTVGYRFGPSSNE
jgi:outer membrane protease